MRSLVILGVLLSATYASAHSFYEYECCSDYDCAPLEETKIEEKDGGWTLWDGRHVPYRDKRVKPSPDGQFHLCEQKWEPNTADRKILCLYAPIGGS